MKKVAALGVTATVVLTALVGLAHTTPFRHLLAKSACPLGGDVAATAAQREATRQRNLAPRAGVGIRPSNVVAGVALGDVGDAEARQVLGLASCTRDRAGLVSECRASPTSTVFLRSNEQGRVVALATVSHVASPAEAEAEAKAWLARLEPSYGAAMTTRGGFDAGALSKGTLAQGRAEWAWADLVLSVTATNLGNGYLVTTEAQVLPAQLARR